MEAGRVRLFAQQLVVFAFFGAIPSARLVLGGKDEPCSESATCSACFVASCAASPDMLASQPLISACGSMTSTVSMSCLPCSFRKSGVALDPAVQPTAHFGFELVWVRSQTWDQLGVTS